MQSTVNCMQIRPFFHKARQHIQMTCLILCGWFESTVQVCPFYLGFTSLRHSITQNEAVKEICSCRVKCISPLHRKMCQLSIVYILKAIYLFAKPLGNNMLFTKKSSYFTPWFNRVQGNTKWNWEELKSTE